MQRAEDRKASLEEAEKSLADLEEVHQHQINEQGGFKAKKDQLKRDIASATQRLEVKFLVLNVQMTRLTGFVILGRPEACQRGKSQVLLVPQSL